MAKRSDDKEPSSKRYSITLQMDIYRRLSDYVDHLMKNGPRTSMSAQIEQAVREYLDKKKWQVNDAPSPGQGRRRPR